MLDLELQKLGLLSFINSIDDCYKLALTKKSLATHTSISGATNQLEQLIDHIIQNSKQNTAYEDSLS